MKKALDWKDINWPDFQEIIVELSTDILPEFTFYEFLRHGQKQHGIDILSDLPGDDGRFAMIQCKKVEEIDTAIISSVTKEFEEGRYFLDGKCSHFVLAFTDGKISTSVDQLIYEIQKKYLETNNIRFIVLDRKKSEGKLRNRFNLVSHYFSPQQAKEFCIEPSESYRLSFLEKIPHYIQRRITPVVEVDHGKYWEFWNKSTYGIETLFDSLPQQSLKICILADGQQGKSSLLTELALHLNQPKGIFQPLFLNIKDFDPQPISGILDDLYRGWLHRPQKEIVVILDGIDELSEADMVSVAKNIGQFQKTYHSLNIVCSCRQNFFDNIQQFLRGFGIYELVGLDRSDIIQYVNSKLETLASNFMEEVKRADADYFLYDPLYLTTMTDEYLKSPHALLSSHVAIIDSIIHSSQKKSLEREFSKGTRIAGKKLKYIKGLENLAYALQLSGKNNLTEDECQELFSEEDRSLLRHNPLVSFNRNKWSISKAYFQEHIAAKVLTRLSIEQIKAVCMVGISIKKIKAKWLHTISKLLSMLTPQDTLYSEVFQMIEGDNIELLFKAESSNFDDELKLDIATRLLDKCQDHNVRPMIVHEGEISRFINNSKVCADLIISKMLADQTSTNVRVITGRILAGISLNDQQVEQIMKFIEMQLAKDKFEGFEPTLLNILVEHKLGDLDLLNRIVGYGYLNTFHVYRDKVYELINTLGFNDEFFEYGLRGISFLKIHNTGIHHGGSERSLQKMLLGAEKKTHLKKLLEKFSEDEWASYFHVYGGYGDDFLKDLFKKLLDKFQSDFAILFIVADFLMLVERRYARSQYLQLDVFLKGAGVRKWMVLHLMKEIFNNHWLLGSLIDEDSFDIILHEFEIKGLHPHSLQSLLGGINFTNNDELLVKFRQVCVDATEGRIFNQDESSEFALYRKAENIRLENDLKHIASSRSFTNALKKFFKAFGSNAIPEDDVYLDIAGIRLNDLRLKASSNFIYHYLTKWNRRASVLKLDECLQRFNSPGFFEKFRATEILDYSYGGPDFHNILLPYLQNFYNTNLENIVFDNCIKSDGGTTKWNSMPFLITNIFKKFQFETPDKYLIKFIWADMTGTKGLDGISFNNQVTLSGLVLKQLTPQGIILLRKEVLSNINKGIESESVFGTHIDICKHLQITESRDILLEQIKLMSLDHNHFYDSIDLFLKFKGNVEEIANIYRQIQAYDHYSFYLLSITLYKMNPRLVLEKGELALMELSDDMEQKLRMACLIAEIGSESGFRFMVETLQKTKSAPHIMQAGYAIDGMDTDFALQQIEYVVHFLVMEQDEPKNSLRDDPAYVVADWLIKLAAKSEIDLKKVEQFLMRAINKLKGKYPKAETLLWYVDRIYENQRSQQDTDFTIEEISDIITKK